MGEVTAYWKAQKILETSVPSVEHGVTRWTWRKPADFPDGVVLKSRLTPPPPHGPKTFGLLADGKTLIPDSSGIFRIPFDAQSLELNPADHSH